MSILTEISELRNTEPDTIPSTQLDRSMRPPHAPMPQPSALAQVVAFLLSYKPKGEQAAPSTENEVRQ